MVEQQWIARNVNTLNEIQLLIHSIKLRKMFSFSQTLQLITTLHISTKFLQIHLKWITEGNLINEFNL